MVESVAAACLKDPAVFACHGHGIVAGIAESGLCPRQEIMSQTSSVVKAASRLSSALSKFKQLEGESALNKHRNELNSSLFDDLVRQLGSVRSATAKPYFG